MLSLRKYKLAEKEAVNMNKNDYYEQEIDIRKLLGYILRKIKSITIVTLIILLVGGLLMVFRLHNSRVAEITKLQADIDKENAEIAKEEAELAEKNQKALDEYAFAYNNAINARDMAVSKYENQLKILDESYINNLDPTDIYAFRILVMARFINTDFESLDKYSSAVLNSELKNVEFNLNSNDFKLKVADVLDIEYDRKLSYVGEVYSTQIDLNTSSVVIEVTTGSKSERDTIEKEVNKLVGDYKVTNPDIVISIDNEELYEGYSASVYDLQQNNQAMLAALAKDVETKNKAVEDVKIAEEKKVEEETKKAPVDLTISIKKIVLKSFAIALLIGLFVSCGYYAAIYILGGKLHGIEEVSNMYKIRHIGELVSDIDIKSNGKLAIKNPKFIKFIEWVEGSSEKYDSDTAKEIVKTNIKNHLGDARKLAVMTSLADENIVDIKSLIEEIKADNGVEIDIFNLREDKLSALKGLAACDKVIILEKSEVSKLKDISEEIYQIRDHNKEIIGIIGC